MEPHFSRVHRLAETRCRLEQFAPMSALHWASRQTSPLAGCSHIRPSGHWRAKSQTMFLHLGQLAKPRCCQLSARVWRILPKAVSHQHLCLSSRCIRSPCCLRTDVNACCALRKHSPVPNGSSVLTEQALPSCCRNNSCSYGSRILEAQPTTRHGAFACKAPWTLKRCRQLCSCWQSAIW